MGHFDVHHEKAVGLTSYSHTGHLPRDPFWDAMTRRHDRDPAAFDLLHPRVAGLFDAPAHPGELPDTPYWDAVRGRFEAHPIRFELHHCPLLVDLLRRDRDARHELA